MPVTWPDVVIVAILLIGALKGWKRGLVAEIGGFVAIVVAFWAGFHYNGALDGLAAHFTQAGPGSAHVIGLIAFSIGVYLGLLILSLILGLVVKLPVLGIGNSIAGVPIGIAKAVVFVWALIYVGLLFPLSPDVRRDVQSSTFVRLEAQPNGWVDDDIVATLPWFARPFVSGFLKVHRI